MKASEVDLYNVPESIRRLVSLCEWDLFYGPIGATDDDGAKWPGFAGSLDAIKAWADTAEIPGELAYWPEWDGWSIRCEEDEWEEPFEIHDGLTAVLFGREPSRHGRELAPYLA